MYVSVHPHNTGCFLAFFFSSAGCSSCCGSDTAEATDCIELKWTAVSVGVKGEGEGECLG